MTPTKFTTVTIAGAPPAGGTWTDVVQLDRGQTAAMSVSGTLAASTVTLQRRYNAQGDWRDVQTYTAVAELGFFAECGMEIRMGMKQSAFGGSDSVIIDIKTG